eukprot:jgi/Astpho2/9022/e_gw1.00133.187.1_t
MRLRTVQSSCCQGIGSSKTLRGTQKKSGAPVWWGRRLCCTQARFTSTRVLSRSTHLSAPCKGPSQWRLWTRTSSTVPLVRRLT